MKKKKNIVLCSLLYPGAMGINKMNNRCNYAHLKPSFIYTFMNINIKSISNHVLTEALIHTPMNINSNIKSW